ncbi:monoamine oxidase [Tsukamurella pulmonis]|nr:monoamine oxidase [Tsukamurella pulmonis]
MGAGVAGLVAADELRRRGVDVVILEAADRVGGRTLVETTALGSTVDLGGQWLGAGHHRFEDLARELGLTPFRMHSPATPAVLDGPSTLGRAAAPVLAAGLALATLELASRLPTARWNTVPLNRWIDRVPSARARRLLGAIVAATCCSGTDEISVTAFLALARYQRGLATMMRTTDGAQDSLLVEGAGTIAVRLAERLGARVHLGCPVTAIESEPDGVTVVTPAGTIAAARVIVTTPPPVSGRIRFAPALPEGRVSLQQNTSMGVVYKALAVYEEPFWRDRGDAEAIDLGEPTCAVFDSSPPDGPGHLTLLVGGPDARRFVALSAEARRDLLLGRLATRLGPAVRSPASWHEKDWCQEPFIGGGYAALPAIGTREGFYPVQHASTGRIHWAGTETAAEHAGYIEGAIESAHRVVAEVTRPGLLGDRKHRRQNVRPLGGRSRQRRD